MSRFAPSFSFAFLTAFLAIASLTPPLRATTISVGNLTGSPVTLLPNTPNQWVPIYVSGTDTNIHGTDLFVVIGNGGPELVDYSLPAGTKAPHIDDPSLLYSSGAGVDLTSVDLKGNAINGAPSSPLLTGAGAPFDEENPPGSIPQFIGFGADLPGSNVVSDSPSGSILAWLNFDTTGFASGSWPVDLNDTSIDSLSDHTDLVNPSGGTIATSLINGSITIAVPEPASFLLAALGLAGLLGAVCFRRVCQRQIA